MKIKFGDLRRMLQEVNNEILFEDDSGAHKMGVSGDSLDKQVDRYLAEYENDAKKEDELSVDQMESIDWRDLVRGHLLTEEGEGEDTSDDDEALDDAGDISGIDDNEEPEKLSIDKLDVASFANSVVRLIDNYDSMLEVRNTLVRRAKAFLEKAYDDEVITAFEATLRDDHGIVAGENDRSVDAEKFPAPHAERSAGSAAPSGGGV